MYRLVRHLINNPLQTNLILVFVIVAAIASATKLQRLGYPRVDFERMSITTVYPGASPEDVELNVTVKIEDALEELDGIAEYTSRSVENISTIQVKLDPDAVDKRQVKDDIRRAVDSVAGLPVEVIERPRVTESRVDNFSIYEVALAWPQGDIAELRRHALALKDRLLDLDVVRRVYDSGLPDREIQIRLNADKLAHNQVAFEDVIAAIDRNRLRVSAGTLESFTSEKGIVTISELADPRAIDNLIIRSNPDGRVLRIADVGQTIDTLARQDSIIRLNGQPGMSLWVAKKRQADIIRAVQAIRDEVADYQRNVAPANMVFTSTYDASVETRVRLEIVYGNAVVGFILVMWILFMFLDRRVAFWTAAGIPISVGLTVIAMPVLGITINSISLCGLVVVLGMVVDDAIIVSESIYRASERGMAPADAAVYGLRTVIRPVRATIITTVIAFVPIYFIPGMIGDFSREIPSIVILMLAASLIEAATILPAHLAHSGRGRGNRSSPVGVRLINRIEQMYASALERLVARRYLTAAACLAFLAVSGVFTMRYTNFIMFPLDQAYELWIYGTTDRDSSLDNTSRQATLVEDMVRSLPDGVVHSYKTVVGRNADGWINSANAFFMKVILTPATQRDWTAERVKTELETLRDTTDLGEITDLGFYIESGGPPVGKPLEVRIIGNDNMARAELVRQVMADLESRHITDMETDLRDGKEELRLLPDIQRVAAAGSSVADIAAAIRTAFDGTIVDWLHTPDEKVPFRVMLDDDSRDFAQPLHGLTIRSRFGGMLPVEELVESQLTRSPQTIYHYNGQRTNRITGNVDLTESTPKLVYDELVTAYEGFSRDHPGFKLVLGGEAKKSAETLNEMLINLAIAVVAIYFLLTIQFNSFTQPAMVILAIPFGLAGITVAFGAHGMDLSMLAMIGVLGMAGVVVNDSLIMVDMINRIRHRNRDDDPEFYEDMQEWLDRSGGKTPFANMVIAGSRLRLRPILLTTMTTVAGLVPTAYGLIGGYDSFISPMVLAMMWGLLVGTLSVLVVIPVLYAIHDDVAQAVQKLLGKQRSH